jgi:hypothetical protein
MARASEIESGMRPIKGRAFAQTAYAIMKGTDQR